MTDAGLADLTHAGRAGRCTGWGEQRCHDPARALPVVALDQQQAIGQHGAQHPALQFALVVILGVFQQDVADSRRVADVDRITQGAAAKQDRLGKMPLGPHVQRLAPGDPQKARNADRLARTAGRRDGAEGVINSAVGHGGYAFAAM